MKRTVRCVVRSARGLVLAGLLGSGTALAQESSSPEAAPPPSADAVAAPATTPPPPAAPPAGSPTAVTLHQGGISFDGDVIINMSKDLVGKPTQIVPNLYYGVSDELTAGVAHNPGAEVFQAGGGLANAPRGLCVSGTNNGCAKVYNNISADALYSFSRSRRVDLAGHAGVDFLRFSPELLLSVRVGVKAKLAAGPMVIVFDPALNIGATHRDAANQEFLAVPLRVGVVIMSRLNVGASIGVFGPTDHFADLYTIRSIPLPFVQGQSVGFEQIPDAAGSPVKKLIENRHHDTERAVAQNGALRNSRQLAHGTERLTEGAQ